MRGVVLVACAWLATVGAQLPPPIDVFTKGESGYYCVKIPSLIVTASGALLALGEARLNSCSDFTETHLVYKRSFDGGLTWSPLSVLHEENGTVIGNAAPIVERGSGRIVLLFCRNNLEVLQMFSDDDGATWAPPQLLSGVTPPSIAWVGTGPPGGIQLASGRLLVPAYWSSTPGDDGELSTGYALLSDDGGASWRMSANYSSGLNFPNENQAVQLPDGRVLVNSRGLLTARVGVLSEDEGETWSSVGELPGLVQPLGGCEGSTILVPQAGVLVYSGLSEVTPYRYNLSLYTLPVDAVGPTIGGNGSIPWVPRLVVDPNPSAYSSLAVLPGSQVGAGSRVAQPFSAALRGAGTNSSVSLGLLYERSNRTLLIFEPDAISFVPVPLSLLRDA